MIYMSLRCCGAVPVQPCCPDGLLNVFVIIIHIMYMLLNRHIY